MELLRETSLKKIDSKFSELMKQKADIYESMISLEADVIISLFSSAKSHYHDGDYGSTVTDFTTLISKFPDGRLILANSSVFTNSILNDKKLFNFLRFSLTSKEFSVACYSILVPSLYNLGRIDEANSIHEFYVDNNACPYQMLFISQAWEYARARNADSYRKDNQASMKELYETCMELSSPYFSDAMEAYDFGCGSGLFGETLKPHVSKLVGIDFSSTLAKAIRPDVYDDVIIIDGLEMEKLNLPKVDMVAAGGVIQYFGLIPPILTRLIDLIKVGGLMIFDTISQIEEGKCPSSLASVQAYSHNTNYVIETAQKFGLKSVKVSSGSFRTYKSDIFVFKKK